jgi:TRAP-type C4-dicarboxylate transport system permease small subunit
MSEVASEATPRAGRRWGLELLIEVPAVIVTFVMMFHITANAILRTWFNKPVAHTLEITEYWYLPLVAFLGFIAAALRGQHIAADLIFEQLPRVTRRFVLALLLLVSALTCFGFARFGWDEAVHAQEIGQTAGVSELVAWPTYYLAPISFGALTVIFAWEAVRALRNKVTSPVVTDPDDALLMDELAEMEDKR